MKLQPTNLGYICLKFNFGIVVNGVIFIPDESLPGCYDRMYPRSTGFLLLL